MAAPSCIVTPNLKPCANGTAEPLVRVLDASDYKPAAACLAAAFAQDVIADYFLSCPDTSLWTPAQKWAIHVQIMETIVYAHMLKGRVLAIGSPSSLARSEKPADSLNPTGEEAFDAVALWMPPGANMDDWLTVLRSGMWKLKWTLSVEGNERFFKEFLPLLHVTKEEVLGERDERGWYLVYLGTRPGARGKGFAKKMVQQITDVADAEGRPCYLESSNQVNVPLYRKMGFEVRKAIAVRRAEKELKMDIMVREPKNQSDGGKIQR